MNDPRVRIRPERSITHSCRFCKIRRPQCDMTRVPTNPRDLTKWIEILGPVFAENLRHFKYHFICREHFKNPDGSISRFPIRIRPKIEEKSEESSQKMEERDGDCVVMVPPKEEVFDPEIVGLEARINRKPRAVRSNTRNVYPNRDVVSSPPKRGFLNSEVVAAEKNKNSNTALKLCRVCSVRNNEKMMTPVPTIPKSLQKWTKILGSVFFENCLQNPAPHFVCMSHLRTIAEGLCQE